jgi:hypothetical protein
VNKSGNPLKNETDTLHVVPFPKWLAPSGAQFDGTSNKYLINASFVLSKIEAPVLTTGFDPLDQVLAGLPTDAKATAQVILQAPLDAQTPVTWTGQQVQGSAEVLGNPVWQETYSSSKLDVGGSLDGETLDPNSFFVRLKQPEQLPTLTFFDKTITIPAFHAGPLHFDLGLHFLVTGTLTANAGIEVTKVGSSIVFDPNGTFVTLTPKLTTKVDAQVPVDVGPWTLVTATVTFDVTFTLGMTAHWGGPLTNPSISSYQVKATLDGHYDYHIVFGKPDKKKEKDNDKPEDDTGIPFGPYTLFDISG